MDSIKYKAMEYRGTILGFSRDAREASKSSRSEEKGRNPRNRGDAHAEVVRIPPIQLITCPKGKNKELQKKSSEESKPHHQPTSANHLKRKKFHD